MDNPFSKRKWICYRNMPPKLPIISAITCWLFLDRVNAAGWIYGVCFSIIGLIFLGNLIRFFQDDMIDIFKEGKTNDNR